MNDRMYKLRQFHFHDPSEHPIDGKVYPMEMHLVHQAEDGTLLLVQRGEITVFVMIDRSR